MDLIKKPPKTFKELVERAIEESKIEDYKKVKTNEENAEHKAEKWKNDAPKQHSK